MKSIFTALLLASVSNTFAQLQHDSPCLQMASQRTFPQSKEITNLVEQSPSSNIKEYHTTIGYGLSIGTYSTNNSEIKSSFGNVPLLHLGLYSDKNDWTMTFGVSYGVKKSINNSTYIEYLDGGTDGVQNMTHYKNPMVTFWNIDIDYLYKPIQTETFRFVIGPGMNMAVISIKGDEMKGLAGGQIYGDDITSEAEGGGLGIEFVTGFYVVFERVFLQFLAKYQSPGLWWVRYRDVETWTISTQMGIYEQMGGFQMSIGFGMHN